MSLEPTTQKKPTLEINASRQFTAWLYEQTSILLLQLIKEGNYYSSVYRQMGQIVSV
jgi:hypothetical protein